MDWQISVEYRIFLTLGPSSSACFNLRTRIIENKSLENRDKIQIMRQISRMNILQSKTWIEKMTSSWYKLKFRFWFIDFFYSLRKCNATASAVRGAFLGSKCKWWDPGKVISVNRPYKYNINKYKNEKNN